MISKVDNHWRCATKGEPRQNDLANIFVLVMKSEAGERKCSLSDISKDGLLHSNRASELEDCGTMVQTLRNNAILRLA